MTTEIRYLDSDHLAAYFAAMNRTFFLSYDPERLAELRRPMIDFDRTQAGYDGDRVVATFRSFATELTVPGGAALPADAITNVTVGATHRRQGLLTAMMRRDLDAARDRGEAVAVLIASEWPIYGRFGFAPATDHAEYEIATAKARLLDGGTGRVEFADPKQARDAATAVFEVHRRSSPGELKRTDLRFDLDFGVIERVSGNPRDEVHVLCRADDADGTVTGYATYKVTDGHGRQPSAVVEVRELMAADPGSYARLWRFVTEIDLAVTVKAADRSVAEPLRWLLADGRALEQRARSDFLWLRLLDVPRALAERRYPVPGRLVLEVTDDLGYGAGRFALDGGPDGASCAPTTEAADLGLDVRALASAYLGGTTLAELATVGQVAEHRAGALTVADAMFRSATTPWCATWF